MLDYVRTQKRFTSQILDEWDLHPDRTEFHITRLGKVAKYICRIVERDASILDVGCRTGHLLEALWNLGFRNLTGIEISPRAMRICQRKNLNVKLGDIHSFNFEDKEFDMVVMIHTLEHCFDVNVVLENVRSMIKQDGYLLVEVPCQPRQKVPTEFAHYTIFERANDVDFLMSAFEFVKVEERPESWGYGALYRKAKGSTQ